jgi:hypothetical protein
VSPHCPDLRKGRGEEQEREGMAVWKILEEWKGEGRVGGEHRKMLSTSAERNEKYKRAM